MPDGYERATCSNKLLDRSLGYFTNTWSQKNRKLFLNNFTSVTHRNAKPDATTSYVSFICWRVQFQRRHRVPVWYDRIIMMLHGYTSKSSFAMFEGEWSWWNRNCSNKMRIKLVSWEHSLDVTMSCRKSTSNLDFVRFKQPETIELA